MQKATGTFTGENNLLGGKDLLWYGHVLTSLYGNPKNPRPFYRTHAEGGGKNLRFKPTSFPGFFPTRREREPGNEVGEEAF